MTHQPAEIDDSARLQATEPYPSTVGCNVPIPEVIGAAAIFHSAAPEFQLLCQGPRDT